MKAKRSRALVLVSLAGLVSAVVACDTEEPADDFSAGGQLLAGGSAGASVAKGGSGGAAAGFGGSAAVSGSGAAKASGGNAGKVGVGGATTGTGGNSGTGPKGGRAGSTWATGGKAGSQGAGGATGGSGVAGATGGGAPLPESGCGATTWPTDGVNMITVAGVARTFSLEVPEDYDPNRPYPVIFSWHGLGGSMGIYYQLNSTARAGNEAIHLSPQGLDNENGEGAGWWNTDGRDLAFVDALVDWTEGSFCVDDSRLFSVGFSFGAMFSHLIACERGDRFRAIAPIAGSFVTYFGAGTAPVCTHPVPMLGIHGVDDDRVPLADGEAARNVWIAKNGCTTTTVNAVQAGCVVYQDCLAGYPVEWCTHTGMHLVPSFAADVIWEFFRAF